MPAMRRVVLTALVVLAVAGCGGEDAAGPGSDGQPEPSDESAADDTGEDTTPGDGDASDERHDEEADVEATIAVEGGQVRGGVQRIEADVHDIVTLTVTGDVADEVHIHGYDLTEPVAPGEPMTRTFQTDIPGVFEIELEDRGLKLADLEVGG